jgi:hypothetical protein
MTNVNLYIMLDWYKRILTAINSDITRLIIFFGFKHLYFKMRLINTCILGFLSSFSVLLFHLTLDSCDIDLNSNYIYNNPLGRKGISFQIFTNGDRYEFYLGQ